MTERAYFITPVALPENQKYSSFRKPYALKFAYFCLTTYKSENEYFSISRMCAYVIKNETFFALSPVTNDLCSAECESEVSCVVGVSGSYIQSSNSYVLYCKGKCFTDFDFFSSTEKTCYILRRECWEEKLNILLLSLWDYNAEVGIICKPCGKLGNLNCVGNMCVCAS